jgi:hypothetical protein
MRPELEAHWASGRRLTTFPGEDGAVELESKPEHVCTGFGWDDSLDGSQ